MGDDDKSTIHSGDKDGPKVSATTPTITQVLFNVGGRVHEVRRSLLDSFPDTMLARAASDEWIENKRHQDDGKGSIFIDRDGELFRHVLHYMRDRRVSLPITESKAALLKELSYYGFQDVDEHCIDSSTAFHEAVDSLSEYSKQGVEQAQTWSKAVKRLELIESHAVVAESVASEAATEGLLCYRYGFEKLDFVARTNFRSYPETTVEIPWRFDYDECDEYILEGMTYDFFANFDRALFNKFLEKYDLRVQDYSIGPIKCWHGVAGCKRLLRTTQLKLEPFPKQSQEDNQIE